MPQSELVDHLTIAKSVELTEVVKGSRFIARVAPVNNEDDAVGHLVRARQDHPAATHHCSAWRVGEVLRFSDDGEPGGTAGRPMLEVLLKRDLQHVAAVVIRYFGGTRLGAGGLVRAYSGAVAKALDAAGTRVVLETGVLDVTVPFQWVDLVLRLLKDRPSVATLESEYVAAGLRMRLELPLGEVHDLRHGLVNQTNGDVVVGEKNPD